MTVAAIIGIVLILGPAILNSLTADEPKAAAHAQTAPADMQTTGDLHPDVAPQPSGSSD
jgi:hypothetical protein